MLRDSSIIFPPFCLTVVSARVTCEPVCCHLSDYTHFLTLSPADLIYLTVPFYIQRFDFCRSEVDFLHVKLQGYFYSPAPASMFNVKSILYNAILYIQLLRAC